MISGVERHADWLGFLDERLGSAVRGVAGADAGPADALRGLYISDDRALELADELGAPSDGDEFARAVERLGLDTLEAAALAVCVAPELHPRYGRLYGYLQDDVTRRLPSMRLVASLLRGHGTTERDVLGCFDPSRRLRRSGAIRMLESDPGVPLADRSVKIADRLAAFVLGIRGGPAGDVLRRVRPPSRLFGRQDVACDLSRALGAETHIPLVVCGPDAEAVLAAAVGVPLMILDVGEACSADVLADATLACALEPALLCLKGMSDLAQSERTRLAELIRDRPERSVLLASRREEETMLGELVRQVIDVPPPSFAERRAVWEQLSTAACVDDVAARFRLSVEQIHVAAEVSLLAASSRGRDAPEPVDLEHGARLACTSRLGDLAVRLPPAYRWEDLVLPDRQRELLRSITAYLRHRDQVLYEWGYGRTVSRAQGLKVLFAGESGTGKTMAAQVLGAELGLDLFRIDLATVVSKYVGETEKNLERIFSTADGSNAILFFDEADALFGKRSEVSDSHDRYSNIEVAYLLQRIESYPGVVILATNFKRNIDDAFARRLDFVVDFPFPDAADRGRIWRRVLPPEAPLAADVDLEFLAGQFKLAGGSIRNCSLAGAFRAADENEPIAMRHLVQAVAQEYAKQGRLTLEAEFDRFHEMIRSTLGGEPRP